MTNKLAKQHLEKWLNNWSPKETEDHWTDQVTVVIKTFERPFCVVQLITSLKEHYPTIKALVCDDSRTPLFSDQEEPVSGIRWLTLPYELGHTLGAGRNFLLEQTDTPYFFLCDDDHVFTTGTHLEEMYEFLSNYDYDIVGGAQGRKEYGCAVFEYIDGRVDQVFYQHHGLITERVVACDRVSNSFMGKTDIINHVRWNDQVYAHEHADFFLRAKNAGTRIAQMGKTFVDHKRDCEITRNLAGHLFGRFLPHKDVLYRKMRLGKDQKQSAKQLYQHHVLNYHQISTIRDVYSRKSRRALEKLIGKPDDV